MKSADEYRAWKHSLENYVGDTPFDVRDYYYGLHSWAEYNVGDSAGFKGDTRAALRSIKAQVLIIGAKDDGLFDRTEALAAKSAISRASYVEIDSPFGHAACCGSDPEATKVISREIVAVLSKLR